MPESNSPAERAEQIKSDLRHAVPRSIKSSHLTEAIAAGFGFHTHASLVAASKTPKEQGTPDLHGFASRAWSRLIELLPASESPLDPELKQKLIAELKKQEAKLVSEHTSAPTIEQLEQSGAMTLSIRNFLRTAIGQHRRILVIGQVGTGRTTFVNALTNVVPEPERLVIFEDLPEIQVPPGRDAVRFSLDKLATGYAGLSPLLQGRESHTWLVMPEVRDSVGPWALEIAAHTGGAILTTPCSSQENGTKVGIETVLRKLQQWSPWAKAPIVDLIVCLERNLTGHRLVTSCWDIAQDWSLKRVDLDLY